MNGTQMKVDRRRSNLRAVVQQSYHSFFLSSEMHARPGAGGIRRGGRSINGRLWSAGVSPEFGLAGPPVLHSRLCWFRPALRDGPGSSASRLQIHGFSASSVALW